MNYIDESPSPLRRPNDHMMASLLFTHSKDQKTEQLYSEFKSIINPLTDDQVKNAFEAEKKTEINTSHFRKIFTENQRRHIINECFAPENVVLKRSPYKDGIKNRSYSIIKSEKKQLKPINQEELKKRLQNQKLHESIVYEYAEQSPYKYNLASTLNVDSAKMVHSRIERQPVSKFSASLENETKQLKRTVDTKSKTKIRPIKSVKSLSAQIQDEDFKAQPGKLNQRNNFSKTQKYDFSKFRKNRGFKMTVEPKYNLYNIIDEGMNNCIEGKREVCVCKPNEVIASKVKNPHLWNQD